VKATPLGQLPKGWAHAKLAEITAKIGSGATPRGGAAVYLPGRVKWALVRSQNVFDREFSFSDLAAISDEAATRLRGVELQVDDVLLNITGDGVTFGRACIVRDCVLPAVVNQHVAIVRASRNRLIPGYLLAYLTHPKTKVYIASFNTGASRRAVTKGAIESFVVPLPPLPIQRRIADILGAYDDLIENNSRRIRVLEEMARTVYGEMSESMLVRAAGDWMREVALGASARALGYELRTVGDICSEVRRAVLPKDLPGATPYFGLEHLPRRSWAMDSWGEAREANSLKLQVEAGDILFGKIRPYFHKVSPAPVDGVASSDAIVLVPTQPELRALALCAVSSDAFVSVASATANGAKMPRANWSVLEAFPVAVPPISLLQRFESRVGAMVDLVRTLLVTQRNLRATRDLLLPRLLSGEIEVGEAEAAVP
jgi:type I restriction enzyme S subunit